MTSHGDAPPEKNDGHQPLSITVEQSKAGRGLNRAGAADPFANRLIYDVDSGFDDSRSNSTSESLFDEDTYRGLSEAEITGQMVFDEYCYNSVVSDYEFQSDADLFAIAECVDRLDVSDDMGPPPKLYADFLDQQVADAEAESDDALIELLRDRITDYIEETLRQNEYDSVAADIYEALFDDTDRDPIPDMLAQFDELDDFI